MTFAGRICLLIGYADELLKTFVKEAIKFYGKEIYVYNFHCLIHLASVVRNLGSLDEFSSFPFENKLGQLKKLVRKQKYPIQQIVYRLAEQGNVKLIKCIEADRPVLTHEHSNGPLFSKHCRCIQYRNMICKKLKISLAIGNNCIMTTDGKPAIVRNIIKKDDIVYCCASTLQILKMLLSIHFHPQN